MTQFSTPEELSDAYTTLTSTFKTGLTKSLATPAQLEEVELDGGEKEAQKKHQLALLKAIAAVN